MVPKYHWDGLLYLHARLPEDPTGKTPDKLVVANGDFDLAYLTESCSIPGFASIHCEHSRAVLGRQRIRCNSDESSKSRPPGALARPKEGSLNRLLVCYIFFEVTMALIKSPLSGGGNHDAETTVRRVIWGR